jgi:hypothetical protein
MTILLLMAGCSSTPQRIEISAKPIEKPQLVLPKADAVNMRKIEWVLLTPDNFQEEVDKFKTSGRPVVFFALTDQGYENLGLNFSDIRALVQQQQAIILAYKNYYEASNKALDEANESIERTSEDVKSQQNVPKDSILDKLNPFD